MSTIALFDLDDTLVRGNMSFRFGLFMLRRAIFPRWKLLKTLFVYSLYYAKVLPFEVMQKKVFDILFFQAHASHVQRAAQEFCDSVFDEVSRGNVVAEMQSLKNEGATVAIVSSSPDFIVQCFAGKWGIKDCVASRYMIDEEGRFYEVLPLKGSDKCSVLSSYPSSTRTIAYSDSMADLDLLKMVDVPIAVSPSKDLLLYAQKEGWRIIL